MQASRGPLVGRHASRAPCGSSRQSGPLSRAPLVGLHASRALCAAAVFGSIPATGACASPALPLHGSAINHGSAIRLVRTGERAWMRTGDVQVSAHGCAAVRSGEWMRIDPCRSMGQRSVSPWGMCLCASRRAAPWRSTSLIPCPCRCVSSMPLTMRYRQ